MNIIVAGLNHNSAPIDIRERLAFNTADTTKALTQLKNQFPDAEFVLLSTCNRVELYCATPTSADKKNLDAEKIANFFAEFHNLALDVFHKFLYVHQGSHAVRHLLRVVSSLDSMIVGESQIIAQVKKSYSLACKAKSTGKILNRLFHHGFATSKNIHTTTSISTGRTSVAGVAVELAMQIFPDVSSSKALVIGAGEMGGLLVQHLLHVGCEDIVVVNRSYERTVDMANLYGISGQKWEKLHENLIAADIVIAATGAQDYLLEKNSFAKIANKRQGSLLIIDIAVPRNFEPTINELEDIYLYSIDDLSDVVEHNRKAREKDIIESMRIIDKSVTDFMNWFRVRDIGPLIGQMRQKLVKICQKELDSFSTTLTKDAQHGKQKELIVKHIVNKSLHCVIKNVDLVAHQHSPAEAAKLIDNIMQQAEDISRRAGQQQGNILIKKNHSQPAFPEKSSHDKYQQTIL
ncbi:MAG: glutamyl-tRNA reductase [Phycisphaerae bacterium]|nr:glutamyl-tRNA reductase [Phycisphaerae bacterium]